MEASALALRVLARYKAAGMADDLSAKIKHLLSPSATREDFAATADWLLENFQFKSPRTPKGQAKNKMSLGYLYNVLKTSAITSDLPAHVRNLVAPWNREYHQQTLAGAWGHVEPHLDEIAKAFTSEGGVKTITRETVVDGNTYVNLVGVADKAFQALIDTVAKTFATLKTWHKKALAGGIRVVFAGPSEFRGTASGVYRTQEKSLYIRATANGRINKTPPDKYGSLGYVINHELGHRYEHTNRVSIDFDKPEWWTTTYSRNEGESFAELFALSNFDMTGPWNQEIVNRFDARMGA